MAYKCDCGKRTSDGRGRKGHVKWSDAEGHGEKGEVPDDWTDLWTEVSDDGDDGGSSADASDLEEATPEADDSSDDSSGSDTASVLREALLEDARAITRLGE